MATFYVATETGPLLKTGRIYNLTIAGKRHKFAVATGGATLTEYRTGFRFGGIGGLSAVKVECLARNGMADRRSDREAAAILVARTIDALGVDKVLACIAAQPTLNAPQT
jgi:purine nucleoside phosphorylase